MCPIDFCTLDVTEICEALGDSTNTTVLLSWNKRPGDAIAEGDVIAVVTMDIRAKKSGTFVKGLVAAQSEICVGAPLYKMDTSAKGAAKHKRLIFLGDLSLWVRDTHLKEIVNSVTMERKLRAIVASNATVHKRSPLDFIPGVLDYIDAGYDKSAMWMDDDRLRDLAVRNFEVLVAECEPFYDVALLLQRCAMRGEQFHIAYPILRNPATAVESLGRFLRTAPGHIHTLDSQDVREANRKLVALQSIYEKMRLDATDNASDELDRKP